jgi:hypothetical protein
MAALRAQAAAKWQAGRYSSVSSEKVEREEAFVFSPREIESMAFPFRSVGLFFGPWRTPLLRLLFAFPEPAAIRIEERDPARRKRERKK